MVLVMCRSGISRLILWMVTVICLASTIHYGLDLIWWKLWLAVAGIEAVLLLLNICTGRQVSSYCFSTCAHSQLCPNDTTHYSGLHRCHNDVLDSLE